MTAADKLRELLATRPAQPNAEELVRWWRTSGDLVPALLADLEGLDCDLAAERSRSAAEREELLVKVQVLERRRPDAAEMARLDKEVARLRLAMCRIQEAVRSRDGVRQGLPPTAAKRILDLAFVDQPDEPTPDAPTHPASWLDCENCRSLSKSGAEPPRCDDFIEMEAAQRGLAAPPPARDVDTGAMTEVTKP